MSEPTAVGDHVYLRPLVEDDAPTLVRWFGDPEVARALRAWQPAKGAEAQYLQEIARSEHDLSLGVCTKDDRLVGVAGLQAFEPESGSAMLAIVIGEKNEWGKGYGTEATALVVGLGFATLGLRRIWLEVLADNERGLRAYEKVGFKREGALRHTDLREGRRRDSLVMAILRGEWQPLR